MGLVKGYYMVKAMDFASRRKAVLAATIDRYIQEAEPIASEDIARDFEVSPATIRHIFAELEADGYLTHPYTSGGRIPTEKGYRYYVDFLSSQMQLLEGEKKHIISEYDRQISRIEDILEKTSEVISSSTNYAGIVSFEDWQDKFFYRGISRILGAPEFQDLSRMRRLVEMIEERQRLLEIINRDFNEKVKVYIGGELGCAQMESCSLVVSVYRIKSGRSGRLAVLGPSRMQYSHIIPTLAYISGVLSDVLDEM